MKKQTQAISIFGGLSLLAGGMALLSSFITYHPSIQQSANRFMAITAAIWMISLLITLILSISAVPLASEADLSKARLLRRRGLWYSVPQITVILFLVVAGWLFARDI